MHHVKGHHEYFPDRIAQRTFEHLVGVVDDRSLGDADVPDLALAFFRVKYGRQRIDRIAIVVPAARRAD